jgi:hypothetical protein
VLVVVRAETADGPGDRIGNSRIGEHALQNHLQPRNS